MTQSDLARLWSFFSDQSAGAVGPTYRDLAAEVAGDPELLGIVEAAHPDARHPTVLFAAVRYLLAGEPEQPLAQRYAGDISIELVPAFRAFVLERRDALLDVMAVRRTQTNEVARTAVLAPALREVQRRHRLPLALADVGTSAGLNLLVDKIGHDYGRFRTGPDQTLLTVECALMNTGPEPGEALRIGWRVGLDRSPVDVADPDQARWLEACVWPDHPERIERLHQAIALAGENPSHIVAGDGVADLAATVADAPPDHHLTIVTSWVTFYFDPETRLAFEAAMAALGRPVSWISMEFPGIVANLDGMRARIVEEGEQSAVGLVEFDGTGASGTREFLGFCHPHGRNLDWAL